MRKIPDIVHHLLQSIPSGRVRYDTYLCWHEGLLVIIPVTVLPNREDFALERGKKGNIGDDNSLMHLMVTVVVKKMCCCTLKIYILACLHAETMNNTSFLRQFSLKF